ncbi:hypothetical protein [Roseofilum capinflatum]|uniref:Uncharacterized protein n=1 Tax=Roseofilum capinflatum BLCC-M114 TaxID=3022440 RepID=A0ABT7B0R5_9CYAN|nr:hypothetical protein [Roseofilum capinflatum]MDJ1172735.1 hypothetical protein [Roseofilum capinflatum BLCC-M114]
MSLIHLDKSVVTFHLKEILEDGNGNHPLFWVGLGVLVLAPTLLPDPQPVNQRLTQQGKTGKTEISLSEWVAQAQKKGVES